MWWYYFVALIFVVLTSHWNSSFGAGFEKLLISYSSVWSTSS